MLKNLVQEKILNLVQKTKNQLDNLKTVALGQAWKILDDNVTDVVLFLQEFATELSKPEKKAQAMLIMSEFYDKVFTVVEFPFVPKLLQPIIQKYVKQLLLDILVSSAIDSTVSTLKRTGVIKEEKTSAVEAEFILADDATPKISDK